MIRIKTKQEGQDSILRKALRRMDRGYFGGSLIALIIAEEDEWYQGRIDGQTVAVCLKRKGRSGFGVLVVGVPNIISDRFDLNAEVREDYTVLDAWSDFLVDRGREGDYQVGNFVNFVWKSEDNVGGGFWYDEGEIPKLAGVRHAEKWLAGIIRNGMAAYRRKAAQFLEELDIPSSAQS